MYKIAVLAPWKGLQMLYTFRHQFFGGLYLRGKPVKTYNHLNLKTLSSEIQSNKVYNNSNHTSYLGNTGEFWYKIILTS